MSTAVDTRIMIGGEEFDLCSIPGEGTELIKREKGNVLKNLDLEKLIKNLERSADLLFLAYNGVAGFGELRAATNKLQDDLALLCRDAELALDRFRLRTKSILGSLKNTFQWLTEGEEGLALGYLDSVASIALEMANEAQDLANRFDGLADETRAVCSSTEIQQGKTDEEKQALDKKLKELQAASVAAKKEAKALGELKEDMHRFYKEAKTKAETAEGRAFGLAITSAIMKPLAEGVGAFAGAYTRMQTGANLAIPPTMPAKPESTQPAKEAEAKTEAEKELASAKTEAKQTDTALETAKEETSKAQKSVNEKEASVKVKEKAVTDAKGKRDAAKNPSEKEKEKFDNAVTKAEAELETAQSELKTARGVLEEKQQAQKTAEALVATNKQKVAAKQAAFDAAAQALQSAANQISEAGKSYMDLAQKYEETRKDYLDKWLTFKKEEAQKLGEIEKYAVEMSNVKSFAEIKKTVSQSLIQAVKAFNEVSQILRTAAQFWQQMAEACKAVGPDSKLQQDLKLYTEKLSPEKRVKAYTRDDFKTNVVEYMARWKALEIICADYSRAASKTRSTIQANIIKSPSPEESIKLVAGLGKNLIEDAKLAQADLDKDIAEIEKAKAAAVAA